MAFLMVGLTACHTPKRDARSIQRTLLHQQTLAEQNVDSLLAALERDELLTDWIARTDLGENILYYVYQADRLIYWSDNWLSADDIRSTDSLTGWWYERFNNAHVVARWMCTSEYDVLVVIPIKYQYQFENRQLHNTFIPPFSADEQYQLSGLTVSGFYPVYAADSTFLFSLTGSQPFEQQEAVAGPLADSFSYRQLVDPNADRPAWYKRPRMRVRLYWILLTSLFGVLLVLGVIGLVRHRGFRNMPLRTRVVYAIMAMLCVAFAYVFFISTRYVRNHYQQRQEAELLRKTLYIQSHLHDLYFSSPGSRLVDGSTLSSDLLKLSYTYETDIHLYDRQGELLGTSAPELFQKGLASTLMASAPFFTGDSVGIYHEQIGDMRYLAGYIPLLDADAEVAGYVAVPLFVSELAMHREVNTFLLQLLPPCIVMLLLSILVSYMLARGLTRPISRLSQKMSHFRLGEEDNHIDYAYRDELGELVERYNEMVDQVEQASRQLARSEREGAWRTMARQIAHEINNLLTPIKLNIQQLQRMRGTDRFDTYFDRTTDSLVAAIDNLSHIATSFSSFAKMPEVEVSRTDVAQRLSSVVTLMRTNTESVPIRYVGPDAGVMAQTDPEQIGQVFTNIIKNAIQAIGDRKDADIIIILNTAYSAKEIEISISDNGPGISAEDQPKIFVPNFTTKTTGTGLGLAISKNIVEGSGGRIRFETNSRGTTFFVYLPKI
ncbi:MAG: HAMP domain-containing histidine kinase [Paludibacteraceae bacterium]|nr:HAMP domain-containing histidine kinase [Paludibacteraceae bacterium]